MRNQIAAHAQKGVKCPLINAKYLLWCLLKLLVIYIMMDVLKSVQDSSHFIFMWLDSALNFISNKISFGLVDVPFLFSLSAWNSDFLLPTLNFVVVVWRLLEQVKEQNVFEFSLFISRIDRWLFNWSFAKHDYSCNSFSKTLSLWVKFEAENYLWSLSFINLQSIFP